MNILWPSHKTSQSEWAFLNNFSFNVYGTGLAFCTAWFLCLLGKASFFRVIASNGFLVLTRGGYSAAVHFTGNSFLSARYNTILSSHLESLHNINDSLVCYWQWLTEISTVLVHVGASSSCIWTSYYMQCQRFLLFVWARFICRVMQRRIYNLGDFVNYIRNFSILFVSAMHSYVYCAILQYVWHHSFHNTPQWSTYTQDVFFAILPIGIYFRLFYA